MINELLLLFSHKINFNVFVKSFTFQIVRAVFVSDEASLKIKYYTNYLFNIIIMYNGKRLLKITPSVNIIIFL